MSSFESAWTVLPKFLPTGKKIAMSDVELFTRYVVYNFLFINQLFLDINGFLSHFFKTIQSLAAIALD